MLTANLEPETHEIWTLFANSRSVTVTGLVEAIGRELARHDEPDAKLPPWLRRAVQEARTIDPARRRR